MATIEGEIHDRAIHCDGCGSRFPVEEGHRASKGYCECGGELILERELLIRLPNTAEQIAFTVVKSPQ